MLPDVREIGDWVCQPSGRGRGRYDSLTGPPEADRGAARLVRNPGPHHPDRRIDRVMAMNSPKPAWRFVIGVPGDRPTHRDREWSPVTVPEGAEPGLRMKLRLLGLYPDQMNIYRRPGQHPSQHRCEWRRIEFPGLPAAGRASTSTSQYDLLYMGGGQDRDQKAVART